MATELTIESLIGWLETMPADGRYRTDDYDCCMMAQWAKAVDPKSRSRFDVGLGVWAYEINGSTHDLFKFCRIALYEPHDFGSALERARELQATS